MLNWLKSGKLSSGTSHDKVVGHEGGEGPRESEDLEAKETERIGTAQGEENERQSGLDAPEETEEEGKRWQKRGDEGEHQKKKGNMMKIIWVWASRGSAIQIAQSLSAWCAVRF